MSIVFIAVLYLHSLDPNVGYLGGERVAVSLTEIPGKDLDGRQLRLRSDAAESWLDLLEMAAREGVELRPTYAFRTHDQQKDLRKRNGRLAAKPGKSSHQAGLSVDVSGVRRNRHSRQWLQANAPRACFFHDVRREPWHITFDETCQSKKL